ncbi:MAG: hypothetical protein ABW110_25140 [Steroidobacteraceae bacterium]
MRVRCWLILSILIGLFGCGGGNDGGTQPVIPATQKPGVLAISALPRLDPLPTTSQEFAARAQEAFDMSYTTGARGQFNSFTWATLEPTQGTYDAQKFDELNSAIATAQTRGMVELVGLQVINTNSRDLPADLMALPFNDPAVIARFHALLDRVLTSAHRGQIRYLSIGNEVDAYLRVNPQEWPQYGAFYRDAVAYAHTLDPNVKVGVTGTADGALVHSPMELTELNSASDVVILTYYPLQFSLQGDVTVRSPTVVASDFPQLLNFAGAKPLVLQEVGYPAATLNASSDALQAQFITNVFGAWRNANGKIPFLNYFLLHDFPQPLCDDLSVKYGAANNASFNAFLCSLGLRTVNGTPRSGWNVLTTEAQAAGLP